MNQNYNDKWHYIDKYEENIYKIAQATFQKVIEPYVRYKLEIMDKCRIGHSISDTNCAPVYKKDTLRVIEEIDSGIEAIAFSIKSEIAKMKI